MSFINTKLFGKRNPYARTQTQFPNFQKPLALGCFSLDQNRVNKNTTDSLRYFRMPSIFPLNLNTDNEQAKTKPTGFSKNERLFPMLRFILDHQEDLLTNKLDSVNTRAVEEIDFICFRGSLRVVLKTPFEGREGWCIQATKFKGNIYLNEKEQETYDEYNDQQRYAYGCGLKFEQHCLVASPYEEPVTNVPVEEAIEFLCVFKRQFSNINLLYGSVMDGILSDEPVMNIENNDILNSLKFMELSCSLRPITEQQHRNFCRFKCRNWWCMSFLAGINDNMIGYRNESGFVDEIVHMDTESLVQQGANFWDPLQCVDFLVKFLNMVKREMKDIDCPHTVYEFYFKPPSREITYRIYAGKSSNTLLSDWYVTALQNRFVEVP